MKIAYNNIFDDSELEVSSEHGNYPGVNTQQQHLSLAWRSDTNTDEWLKISNVTEDVTCAFIAGVNLDSNAVVTLQGNSTDSWSSPNVSKILERGEDIYYAYFNSENELYWRFLITNPLLEDDYIVVGRAWIGTYIDIMGPSTTFSEIRNDTSEFTISQSGQSYGDIGYVYRSWQMAYPYWDEEEKSNVETFALTVRKSIPFFSMFADKNDKQLGPFYTIMTNDLTFTHLKTLDIWSSGIDFREVF